MSEEDYIRAVEVRIKEWFNKKREVAPTDEAKLLLSRMQALVQRGGKRARPRLLYITYKAYGGDTIPEQLIDLGAALELHHQFLLVHDDLIDNDAIRYNGPNIVGYYRQDPLIQGQSIAEAMGLLAGDLLFSFSNDVILHNQSLTDTQKVEILVLLNAINADVVYGQQLDTYNVDPTLETFTIERLLLTHTLKSARYSTQLPMQVAACLIDLEPEERTQIDMFAVEFGLLFQLADDFSDYFQNESVFNNRPKYRDYRQGKITYPLYKGLTLAGQDDAAFLKKHLGTKDLSDGLMQQVVSTLETCGATTASREYIQKTFETAHQALEMLHLSNISKQQFTELLTSYIV